MWRRGHDDEDENGEDEKSNVAAAANVVVDVRRLNIAQDMAKKAIISAVTGSGAPRRAGRRGGRGFFDNLRNAFDQINDQFLYFR